MSMVSFKRLSGAVVAAALLAACTSTGSYAPPASSSTTSAAATSATGGDFPACGVPGAKLPGNYVFMQALGKSGGSNVEMSGTWAYGTASPTGTAAAKRASRPDLPAADAYVYIGSYSLRSAGRGCAYLVVSMPGSPPVDGDDDAMMTGAPTFGSNAYTFKVIDGGNLSGKMTLATSGGYGTLTLHAGNRGKGTSGAVIFKQRIERHAPTPGFDPMSALQPHAALPCSPDSSFVYNTIQNVTTGSTRKLGFLPRADNFTYLPVFEFCGVENSVLGNPDPVAGVQHFAFSHGRIDYWTDVSFSAAYPWASHPDVAAWDAAYTPGFVRDPRYDIRVAVLHVR